jgi:hypothetical protein
MYFVIIPLTVGVLVGLIMAIRGRRLRAAPACPKCRYHVEHIPTSTCPECGQDLVVSGVLSSMRQPAPRWVRAIIVVLFFILLFSGFSHLTDPIFFNVSRQLFGEDHWHLGEEIAWVKLQQDDSAVNMIQVMYPASEAPASAPVSVASSDLWVFPRDVEVTVTFYDGPPMTLRLEPTVVGFDPDPSTAQWSLVEDGESVVFHPEAYDDTTSAGQVRWEAYGAELMGTLVASRIRSREQVIDPWDPGAFIAERMVESMMNIVQDKAQSIRTHGILGESARSAIGYGTTGLISDVNHLRVRPVTVARGAWIGFSLIVLVVVMIPGPKTEAFEANAAGQQTA